MSDTIVLKETTVTPVGDTRVGCGNIWERSYALPDGSPARGLTAKLAPLDVDEAVVVGEGSVVDLGGAVWRVLEVAKVQGRPGSVRLAPAEQAVTIGDVSLGRDADLDAYVRDLLARPHAERADDRLPVDALQRRYDEALRIDRASADRLSRAVAGALDDDDTRVARQVLLFFQRRPRAAGGERLGASIAAHLDRFPRTQAPLGGDDHLTYRQRALLTALNARPGEGDPDPALLRLARDEALAGHGDGLVAWLVENDPAWGSQHIERLIAANPSALGDLYISLRALGEGAAATFERLFSEAAGDAARRTLYYAVRFDDGISDPAQRASLMARALPKG